MCESLCQTHLRILLLLRATHETHLAAGDHFFGKDYMRDRLSSLLWGTEGIEWFSSSKFPFPMRFCSALCPRVLGVPLYIFNKFPFLFKVVWERFYSLKLEDHRPEAGAKEHVIESKVLKKTGEVQWGWQMAQGQEAEQKWDEDSVSL